MASSVVYILLSDAIFFPANSSYERVGFVDDDDVVNQILFSKNWIKWRYHSYGISFVVTHSPHAFRPINNAGDYFDLENRDICIN